MGIWEKCALALCYNPRILLIQNRNIDLTKKMNILEFFIFVSMLLFWDCILSEEYPEPKCKVTNKNLCSEFGWNQKGIGRHSYGSSACQSQCEINNVEWLFSWHSRAKTPYLAIVRKPFDWTPCQENNADNSCQVKGVETFWNAYCLRKKSSKNSSLYRHVIKARRSGFSNDTAIRQDLTGC